LLADGPLIELNVFATSPLARAAGIKDVVVFRGPPQPVRIGRWPLYSLDGFLAGLYPSHTGTVPIDDDAPFGSNP